MNKQLYTLIILILLSACKSNQVTNVSYTNSKRDDYIKQYSNLSVKEMRRSGIPASITLAQALLESNNGNSTLARKANNHFGVKCHNSWKGKKIYHDDDRRGECFRKYRSVYDSYKDHSDFIVNGRRYRFLFDYKKDNYKAWAKGLQKAGYATSRTYSRMLIKIIEDNKLYLFDNAKNKIVVENNSNINNSFSDVGDFSFSINKHRILNRNRIDYIQVKKGDTYESLNEEFDLLSWELEKYNDIDKMSELTVGQVLYLQPKRNKAEVKYKYHIVKNGETMYTISQLYGVKLRKLYDRNSIKNGKKLSVGEKILLR